VSSPPPSRLPFLPLAPFRSFIFSSSSLVVRLLLSISDYFSGSKKKLNPPFLGLLWFFNAGTHSFAVGFALSFFSPSYLSPPLGIFLLFETFVPPSVPPGPANVPPGLIFFFFPFLFCFLVLNPIARLFTPVSFFLFSPQWQRRSDVWFTWVHQFFPSTIS